MIRRGRLEDGICVEIFHRDLDQTQDEHVRRGKSAESVHKKPDELQGARDEASRALREPLQVTLGIGSEVQEAHEQTAHEEESVDAEGSVRDGLKEKPLLHHFTILHVVRILEKNDARVPKDNPGHRYRSEPVHCADGVSTHIVVADDLQVGTNGKRKQKFLKDTCKSNRNVKKIYPSANYKKNFYLYYKNYALLINFLNQKLGSYNY